MLEKKFRLRKRTEFAYSFKHGKTSFGQVVNVCVFGRKDKLLRIGFSVSKKVGGAVTRNRVRRQLQAIVREKINEIERGFNLIFVARPEIEKLEFEDIKKAVLTQIKRAGVIQEDFKTEDGKLNDGK